MGHPVLWQMFWIWDLTCDFWAVFEEKNLGKEEGGCIQLFGLGCMLWQHTPGLKRATRSWEQYPLVGQPGQARTLPASAEAPKKTVRIDIAARDGQIEMID